MPPPQKKSSYSGTNMLQKTNKPRLQRVEGKLKKEKPGRYCNKIKLCRSNIWALIEIKTEKACKRCTTKVLVNTKKFTAVFSIHAI